MKKSTKPDADNYIFTEAVDYSKTGKESIWGSGDPGTLDLLKNENIKGNWLNLAAGDGRYNFILLKKADNIIASDIDEGAINKLYYNTPKEFKSKLKLKIFDITQKFPFEDNSFDGIFCAGTLHLFPEQILKNIFDEIYRTLKPSGKIIIDFATDVRRVLQDGKLYIRKGEPQYDIGSAKKLLSKLLKDFDIKLQEDEVSEDIVHAQGFDYRFSCKFILLVGHKKQ